MALILVEPFVFGLTTDIPTAGSNDYSRFTAIPFLVGERCGYQIEIKSLFHAASPNID
ncbi:hypothetical protein MACH10_36330 [Thalassospira tepidiphila]|nr:hypothetical protein MACH10_36330 [Thalassospira tepidiphila]